MTDRQVSHSNALDESDDKENVSVSTVYASSTSKTTFHLDSSIFTVSGSSGGGFTDVDLGSSIYTVNGSTNANSAAIPPSELSEEQESDLSEDLGSEFTVMSYTSDSVSATLGSEDSVMVDESDSSSSEFEPSSESDSSITETSSSSSDSEEEDDDLSDHFGLYNDYYYDSSRHRNY